MFAILGCRALHFALPGPLPYFHSLKDGPGIIVIPCGMKKSLIQDTRRIDVSVARRRMTDNKT